MGCLRQLLKYLFVAFLFSPSQSGNQYIEVLDQLIKFSVLPSPPLGRRWSEVAGRSDVGQRQSEGENIVNYENLHQFCISLYNFSLLNRSVIFHTVLL